VRAALCTDAETAVEIVDAFLATDPDEGGAATIARVE
jgi:hypothetical protein